MGPTLPLTFLLLIIRPKIMQRQMVEEWQQAKQMIATFKK